MQLLDRFRFVRLDYIKEQNAVFVNIVSDALMRCILMHSMICNVIHSSLFTSSGVSSVYSDHFNSYSWRVAYYPMVPDQASALQRRNMDRKFGNCAARPKSSVMLVQVELITILLCPVLDEIGSSEKEDIDTGHSLDQNRGKRNAFRFFPSTNGAHGGRSDGGELPDKKEKASQKRCLRLSPLRPRRRRVR